MEDLLKLYCHYNPEFLETINSFKLEIKQKVLKKLKKANNKTHFRSTIAEIQFGILFNQLGFKTEYERKFFNKQTPDWTISLLNSNAICDVYRIGKSKKDQIRSDFENHLTEKIECSFQNPSYLLFINYNNKLKLFAQKTAKTVIQG